MASFNKIVIVGYLGRDPEIRYTPQGVAVCNFSIATTERRKDKTGEPQDVTTWFNATAWRQQAEFANQYLSKGKQVYLEGKLSQEEYTDREGVKRQSLKVNVTEIHLLGQRGDEMGGGSAPRPSGGQSSASSDAPEPDGARDEDIPF
jgi:single-strand DNA-binding protein